ncbi:substrate-binding domain-containing protein [Methylocella tundrae]|uniref:Putative XoxJ- and MxaJ-like protein Extracellular solute-binding protein family 3 n=1 Tax=Methylocella tundrae TaxID=227605 RepID=A0A4U8Z6S7_METTU|nr:substrate-binding domain-containing protein [Methylocella tundrae]WPP02855.1 substrate-binding domain-containing protein [Methylocella tundrae]VFU16467.1 putative XoxJ- and MxaJ-like protein precursor; Extracellular solute-binding protein family 3 [Methylocella tundrae]
MSSRFLKILTAVVTFTAVSAAAQGRELRVCADPNNLPYSDAKGAGFENKIAQVIASDIGADLSYFWFAQRRGFLRNTLNANACDVVIGIPAGMHMLRTTKPYYRSGYVFVTREDRPPITSFDDPSLAHLKIGVQLTGNDGVNTPPAHELGDRGIVSNIRGFMVYGDYAEAAPLQDIVSAVTKGDIDVAIVWGPQAGWFASKQPTPLRVTPVADARVPLPMSFDIAMGVRKSDEALAAELEAAMIRRRADIDAILADYRVPRFAIPSQKAEAAP